MNQYLSGVSRQADVDSYIVRLKRDRKAAFTKMRQILDTVLEEKRHMTGEEKQSVDRMQADIDALELEIDQWEQKPARDAAEESLAEARNIAYGGARFGESPLSKWLRSKSGSPTFEIQPDHAMVRALSTGTTNAPVPVTTFPTLYRYLFQMSGVLNAGARFVTTAAGEQMNFPKANSYGTALVTSEGATMGTADPVFGSVTLNAYKYGSILKISNELLQDSAVDLEEFISEQAAWQLDLATGPKWIYGTGSSQIQGLAPAAGTAVTATAGGTGVPSYSTIVDLVHGVSQVYRRNAVFLAGDGWVKAARKLVDTTGRPLWAPSVTAGAADTLLGFPVVTDGYIASPGTAGGTAGMTAFFGDFNRGYLVRQAGPMRFERSNDAFFSTDETGFRVAWRVDADILDPLAVKGFYSGTT